MTNITPNNRAATQSQVNNVFDDALPIARGLTPATPLRVSFDDRGILLAEEFADDQRDLIYSSEFTPHWNIIFRAIREEYGEMYSQYWRSIADTFRPLDAGDLISISTQWEKVSPYIHTESSNHPLTQLDDVIASIANDKAQKIFSPRQASSLLNVLLDTYIRQLDLRDFAENPMADHPTAYLLKDILERIPAGEDSHLLAYFNRILPQDPGDPEAQLLGGIYNIVIEALPAEIDGAARETYLSRIRGRDHEGMQVQMPFIDRITKGLLEDGPFNNFASFINMVQAADLDDDISAQVIEAALNNIDLFANDPATWGHDLIAEVNGNPIGG